MADLIQFRGDTASRWASVNPVLAEREIGLVTDSKGQFKVGDGVSKWNDLPLWGFDGNLEQSSGTSETSVMSQKAVTELVSNLFTLSTDAEIEQMNTSGSWVENMVYYTAE